MIPLSSSASSAATTANCVVRSHCRICRRLRPAEIGSKSHSAATRDRKGVASNIEMVRVAVRPAVSSSQYCFFPIPPGATTPIPVMTTRRPSCNPATVSPSADASRLMACSDLKAGSGRQWGASFESSSSRRPPAVAAGPAGGTSRVRQSTTAPDTRWPTGPYAGSARTPQGGQCPANTAGTRRLNIRRVRLRPGIIHLARNRHRSSANLSALPNAKVNLMFQNFRAAGTGRRLTNPGGYLTNS